MRKIITCLLALCLCGAALAEPLTLTEDLAETVRIELNDRAAYLYSFRYPQVDPAEPAAELINTFYQYLAEDAKGFEVPMNADYYRELDPAEDVRINIEYQITCNGEKYFSVLIHTEQDALHTYAGHTFSREELRAGSSVALPYLLGTLADGETDTWLQDRQTARAEAAVRQMVWERLEEMTEISLYEDLEEESLEYIFFPEEDFYLDETENPVFYLQPGAVEESDRLITIPISIEEILDEM